jgi:hypothetical protein
MKPPANAMTAYPAAPSVAAAASGTASMRMSMGAAGTMPIFLGSSPRAWSHAVR